MYVVCWIVASSLETMDEEKYGQSRGRRRRAEVGEGLSSRLKESEARITLRRRGMTSRWRMRGRCSFLDQKAPGGCSSDSWFLLVLFLDLLHFFLTNVNTPLPLPTDTKEATFLRCPGVLLYAVFFLFENRFPLLYCTALYRFVTGFTCFYCQVLSYIHTLITNHI